MPTHDFRAPALPGTLRISVIADGDTYVTDFSAAKLDSTLRTFADFAGPDLSADSCTAVAAEAGENADAYLVGSRTSWFTRGIRRIVKLMQSCLPLPQLWGVLLN
jgi:hypothetical protein